jgi:hypothetical protein
MAGKMVDLALSEEERADFGVPCALQSDDAGPIYPYGMKVCFHRAEMDKLGLEDDCDVGDIVYLRVMGTVTSVSSNKRGDGTKDSTIEVQIEKVSVLEPRPNDDDE